MKNKDGILLIGGGGHCTSIIDTLLSCETYNEIAIIDNKMSVGDFIMGIFCIGNDSMLEDLRDRFKYAFIAIGSIGDCDGRIIKHNFVEKIGYIIPNIIDDSSSIGRNVEFGRGIYIGKKAIINCRSKIKNGVIINTGCIIEHDCRIGEFSHVATGAVLCGNVVIGRCTHIGANSSIKQGVTIGDDVMIGMGSVVVKDVNNAKLLFGNPARENYRDK